MTAKEYTHLLSIAQRIAYNANEAQDLLQEALIVAIDKNRLDFSSDDDQKWIAGVMRKKALHESRTISRKNNRDQVFSSEKQRHSESDTHEPPIDTVDTLHPLLDKLSPAARKVAVLVIHGLNRKEICTLLSLSDTAFRQRLTSIRKALNPLPSKLHQEIIALAYASRQQREAQEPSLPVGLIRRALLKSLNRNADNNPQSVGTHDPSGHLIVVSTTNKKK